MEYSVSHPTNLRSPKSCKLLSLLDNRMFEMDFEATKVSTHLRDKLAKLKPGEHLVERLEVPGEVLQKVIEWCVYHQDDPPAQEEPEEYYKGVNGFIGDWDLQFLVMDPQKFFGVVEAAKQLGITGLVNLCCQHIAERIENRTDDEIRNIFKLPAPVPGGGRNQ